MLGHTGYAAGGDLTAASGGWALLALIEPGASARRPIVPQISGHLALIKPPSPGDC